MEYDWAYGCVARIMKDSGDVVRVVKRCCCEEAAIGWRVQVLLEAGSGWRM